MMSRHAHRRCALAISLLSALITHGAFAQHATLTDEQIAAAVEKKLHGDDLTALDYVEVRVEGGKVTLAGEVASLFAKERAGRIAEAVQGVRSVDNALAVDPIVELSAADLQTLVTQALLEDEVVESYEVGVTADSGGEIVLTGAVDSPTERRIAEEVVMEVSGVTSVVNRIDVVRKLLRTDAEIAAEVARRLRTDIYVGADLIDVRVDNAVVHLSGTVGSEAERTRAGILANTAGVQAVRTEKLDIEPRARDPMLQPAAARPLSDESIEAAVRAAVHDYPQLAGAEVNVQVVSGAATLSGTVRNLKTRRAATEAAMSVVGVDSVHNRLHVRSERPLSDDELEREILDALARNPVTESHEIGVRVVGGHAHLNGAVDSEAERQVAEDVVAAVSGVRSIDNDLTTDPAIRFGEGIF